MCVICTYERTHKWYIHTYSLNIRTYEVLCTCTYVYISSMCGKYDLLIGTVNFPPLWCRERDSFENCVSLQHSQKVRAHVRSALFRSFNWCMHGIYNMLSFLTWILAVNRPNEKLVRNLKLTDRPEDFELKKIMMSLLPSFIDDGASLQVSACMWTRTWGCLHT